MSELNGGFSTTNISDALEDALESTFLEDVRRRTGRRFERLSMIPVRSDPELARQILPLAAERLATPVEVRFRRSLYRLFDGVAARKFLSLIVQWIDSEEDVDSLDLLVQSLARLVTRSHAAIVWPKAKSWLNKPAIFILLSRIATFPSIQSEVVSFLMLAIEEGVVARGDYAHIARVRHRLVQAWLRAQRNSPDPVLRRVAMRSLSSSSTTSARRGRSPHPDRSLELFSAEVDLEALPALLSDIGARFDLCARPGKLETSVLAMQLNVWSVAATSESRTMWVRLEDIDVVEVVVTERSGLAPIFDTTG